MDIEVKSFPKDMQVVFVEANSFPEGAQEAFDKLESKVRNVKKVSYYGISNPEQGRGIVYRAAASTLPAIDPQENNLQSLTIKGGDYYSIRLEDARANPRILSEAFKKILSQPGIDPEGRCIEVYDHFNSKGVECIVRKSS
jgi:DNA gyrase inhibitor GyrI